MQHAPQHSAAQDVEMSLRDHLLRESSTSGSAPPPPYPPAPSSQGPSHPYPTSDHSDSAHSHGHQQIDPNVTNQPMPYAMSGEAHGETEADRKGKRELSTSKRAAQNRAAQRAFRQRKEGYIKKLEEQVKEFQTMETNYKALQNENYQLREYILALQSRLLENQSDFPPAPAHANLTTSGAASQPSAEPSYAADQQMRRDMEQRAPPPAPIVAREDPARYDGLNQLHQAATAAQEARPPQASPYGLGSDYPSRAPETSGPESGADSKLQA